MFQQNRKPPLTRKQLRQHLNANGIPIAESTLNKKCSPAINTGPQPVAYWNNRPLYDPDEGLAWAKAELRNVRDSETGDAA
jgi:hypothetical protein